MNFLTDDTLSSLTSRVTSFAPAYRSFMLTSDLIGFAMVAPYSPATKNAAPLSVRYPGPTASILAAMRPFISSLLAPGLCLMISSISSSIFCIVSSLLWEECCIIKVPNRNIL